MGKPRKLLVMLILCLPAWQGIKSQEAQSGEQVLLHGIVMDALTQSPLPDVHYAIGKTLGGSTGGEGKFSLYMNRYDTVVFSYIGYSDFYFTLSDTLVGKSFVAGIFLETDTLAIGEVVVIPRMSDLRSEFRSTNIAVSKELINAQNNLEVATYQGLTGKAVLGDPATNYELLKRKQIITAYEKGGIPSDKMVGLNFISAIPMAIYLLRNGLPERPPPPEPHISERELEKMIELYRQSLLEEKK